MRQQLFGGPLEPIRTIDEIIDQTTSKFVSQLPSIDKLRESERLRIREALDPIIVATSNELTSAKEHKNPKRANAANKKLTELSGARREGLAYCDSDEFADEIIPFSANTFHKAGGSFVVLFRLGPRSGISILINFNMNHIRSAADWAILYVLLTRPC